MKGASLPRLSALTLSCRLNASPGAFPGVELFEAMAGLSALQSLALTDCWAGAEATIALIESPVLGRLRELVFAGLDCLPVAELILAHADRFRGLTRLKRDSALQLPASRGSP